MNATELVRRVDALRDAGEALRRRPAAEVADALAAWLERWRDPHSPEREALERELPAATGFTPEVVRAGIAHGLEPWSGDALRELCARARGADGAALVGHRSTAVLLAGAIPLPTLTAMALPLALRSPVLAKAASRDPVTPRLAAASLAAAGFEGCVEVASFARDERAAVEAFASADCVVATGSDATVDALAQHVAASRTLVRHGHALSIGLLGPDAGDADLRGVAFDTALWDQLGCLSPVAVWVAGDTERSHAVGAALARELAALEGRLPRGAVDARAAALATHERDGAELRAAAGRPVTLHTADDHAWTVVCEADAEPRPAPLHRFLRVHPLPDDAGLERALAPLAPHLAGVALAGFGARQAEVAGRLGTLGATRVCAPGRLQQPPLDWPRDRVEPLRSLADPSATA